MKNLIVPKINLNGNTAEDLVEKLQLVLHNLMHTMESMAQASDVIHGRNFQISDDPLSHQRLAAEAWHERFDMIRQIHEEVMDLAVGIQIQGKQMAAVDTFKQQPFVGIEEVEAYYGKECPEFAEGCPTCRGWRLWHEGNYSQLRQDIDDGNTYLEGDGAELLSTLLHNITADEADTLDFDTAQEAFTANPSHATAYAYLDQALEYEAEGMIGDDTFRNALGDIKAWLAEKAVDDLRPIVELDNI